MKEMHSVVLRETDDVSTDRATRSYKVALARLPNHVERVKVVAKQDVVKWAGTGLSV